MSALGMGIIRGVLFTRDVFKK